ncbi:MAG: hypothetical protein ACKPKO_24040, partial [Candidatus Fonsibacter sp.]
GFRTPNVQERGRAVGMSAYLQDLGLEESELYDAQGNPFDPPSGSHTLTRRFFALGWKEAPSIVISTLRCNMLLRPIASSSTIFMDEDWWEANIPSPMISAAS